MCSAASETSEVPTRKRSSLRDLVDHLPLAGEEACALERPLADQHRRDHGDEALLGEQPERRSGPAPARPSPGRPSGRRTGSPRRAPRAPCRSGPSARLARGGRGPRTRTRAARRPREALRRPRRTLASGASGSGRLGSVSASSSRSRSTSASSASSRLISAASSRIPAISLSASRPRAWPRRSPRRPDSARALPPSTSGSSSRRRASSRSSSSSSSAAPRRASAALTASGSSRMRFRSSTPDLRDDRLRGLGLCRALRPAGLRRLLDVARPTTPQGSGRPPRVVADDDVLRHDRAGEAAVSDREQRVLVADLPLVEVRSLVASVAVARIPGCRRRRSCDSPEQRSANSTAPAWVGSSSGTEMLSLPQAPSTSAAATGIRTRTGRTRRHHTFRRMASREPETTPEGATGKAEAVRPDAFRRAMARFPTAVTVVTAFGPDGPSGLTANAVLSLSLDPPLMLACARPRLADAALRSSTRDASGSTCSAPARRRSRARSRPSSR